MSSAAPQVNSVTLVGHLTRDPLVKPLADDGTLCVLRLGVNDIKDAPPLYIDVITYGSQAEACAKYLTKGRAIAVTGRLTLREWQDEDGKRYARHQVVGRVQFGGRTRHTVRGHRTRGGGRMS